MSGMRTPRRAIYRHIPPAERVRRAGFASTVARTICSSTYFGSRRFKRLIGHSRNRRIGTYNRSRRGGGGGFRRGQWPPRRPPALVDRTGANPEVGHARNRFFCRGSPRMNADLKERQCCVVRGRLRGVNDKQSSPTYFHYSFRSASERRPGHIRPPGPSQTALAERGDWRRGRATLPRSWRNAPAIARPWGSCDHSEPHSVAT